MCNQKNIMHCALSFQTWKLDACDKHDATLKSVLKLNPNNYLWVFQKSPKQHLNVMYGNECNYWKIWWKASNTCKNYLWNCKKNHEKKKFSLSICQRAIGIVTLYCLCWRGNAQCCFSSWVLDINSSALAIFCQAKP